MSDQSLPSTEQLFQQLQQRFEDQRQLYQKLVEKDKARDNILEQAGTMLLDAAGKLDQPVQKAPRIYLWDGEALTSPKGRTLDILPIVGMSLNWVGNKDPNQLDRSGVGFLLLQAQLYNAPIALDEGWTWDQQVQFIKNAKAFAPQVGVDPNKLRFTTYNAPGVELINHSDPNTKPGTDQYYDAFVESFKQFQQHELAHLSMGLTPSLYPVVGQTVSVDDYRRWISYVMPKYKDCAATLNKPVIPVITPSIDISPGTASLIDSVLFVFMLDHLVNEWNCDDIIIWFPFQHPMVDEGHEIIRQAIETTKKNYRGKA